MADVFPSISGLIPELKSGNELAWNDLCDKFRIGLTSKSRRMIGASKLKSKYTPEDLVQESLLKAWKRHREFQGYTTSQLAKWLLTILKNTFLDWTRKSNRESVSPTWFDITDQNETPSQVMISEEREILLHACLASIDGKYQEVLVLRHFEGLKFCEIANRLGKKINTVAGIYRRGISRLADAMDEFN